MTQGTQLITAERERQIEVEGWTPEHDDRHTRGEMADAAACYAIAATETFVHGRCHDPNAALWPWGATWWKPTHDPVRMLVKAGALIAAEIDRQLMAQQRTENPV